MISISILESQDIDSVGEYEFKLDRITLGDTKNSFLTIYENFFEGSFLSLKVIKNNLFINYKNKSYKVNNREFKGTKHLNIGDIILFGSTKIKIISFKQDFDLSLNLSEKITELKKDISNEDSKRLELILQIEDEIINHETNEHRL